MTTVKYADTFTKLVGRLTSIHEGLSLRPEELKTRERGHLIASRIIAMLDGEDMAAVMFAMIAVAAVVETASPESLSGTKPLTYIQEGSKFYELLLNMQDEELDENIMN